MGPAPEFLENLSENTLKGDLSNVTSFNPPLFSLVDTFKGRLGVQDLFYAYSVCFIFHVCMKRLDLEARHLPFRKSLKGKG
jgi:hypothetical protein